MWEHTHCSLVGPAGLDANGGVRIADRDEQHCYLVGPAVCSLVGPAGLDATVKSPNIDFDPKDRHPWSNFYFFCTSSGIELRDVMQKRKNNV
jgi:hypothetical protein